jgi:DNA polymerase-3 subunit delta'
VIIGHQKIIEFLNKSSANGRLAHAYLFGGPEQVGRRTVALDFAKSLQCQSRQIANIKELAFCGECKSCLEIDKSSHPDILIIEPEKVEEKGKKREKDISIEQVRKIQHQVSMFPYYGPYKIVIIDSAEHIRREAANALLKILEEPPENTVFVLIASSARAMLPTIVSRCLLIKFSPVSVQAIYESLTAEAKRVLPEKELWNLLRVSCGRPGAVLDSIFSPDIIKERQKDLDDFFSLLGKDINAKFRYAEDMAKDTDRAGGILSQWIFFFRDLLLLKTGCGSLAIMYSSREKEKQLAGGTISRIFDVPGVQSVINKMLSAWSSGKIKENILQIEKTKKIISNPSFNARLALEALMLQL